MACLYCGKAIPLVDANFWVKGYKPDPTRWSCFNTVTGKSCREKKDE